MDVAEPAREVPRLLPVGRVAELLSVNVSTVRRWEKAGYLRSIRIGPRGQRLFKREHILALLEDAPGPPQRDPRP